MSEPRDPAIKLFGQTIPLPENPAPPPPPNRSDSEEVNDDNNNGGGGEKKKKENDDVSNGGDGDDEGDKAMQNEVEDEVLPGSSGELSNPDEASGIGESSKAPVDDREMDALKSTKAEEEQSETNNSQEKTLKKPDKIIPCPRCKSMETKFCYYNNYNVNQPRHFCKNCQRYWTAGGTMRNVPVGAGRRKNKNTPSQYRHITVSEALPNGRPDGLNGVHHPSLQPNGTVLTFCADTPLCESMTSVQLSDKNVQNCTPNSFRKPEVLIIPAYGEGVNADDHSNRSIVTDSNSSKEERPKLGPQEPVMQNYPGYPLQIPCFPGAPWPYPWNSAQWVSPMSPPAFFPPGYPMPFYPAAAYWGCAAQGIWNMPWVPQPSSPNQTALSSGSNSPTLGKHLRDENPVNQSSSEEEETPKEKNAERCLWIPKTLRIDDPREAAKSSIWETLGIKNDKADSISSGGLFKAFRSKGDEKNHRAEASPVLQANPAALSRSVKFQESS